MNEAKLLKRLADDEQFRNRVRRTVLNELDAFAAREGITTDQVSRNSMQELAEAFVERGLHEKP
jgi:hypothetical protein